MNNDVLPDRVTASSNGTMLERAVVFIQPNGYYCSSVLFGRYNMQMKGVWPVVGIIHEDELPFTAALRMLEEQLDARFTFSDEDDNINRQLVACIDSHGTHVDINGIVTHVFSMFGESLHKWRGSSDDDNAWRVVSATSLHSDAFEMYVMVCDDDIDLDPMFDDDGVSYIFTRASFGN